MSLKKQKIKMAGEAITILMEYCINEKIINPKIKIDAKTDDGEHYRLIFERIDLDEKLNEDHA